MPRDQETTGRGNGEIRNPYRTEHRGVVGGGLGGVLTKTTSLKIVSSHSERRGTPLLR